MKNVVHITCTSAVYMKIRTSLYISPPSRKRFKFRRAHNNNGRLRVFHTSRRCYYVNIMDRTVCAFSADEPFPVRYSPFRRPFFSLYFPSPFCHLYVSTRVSHVLQQTSSSEFYCSKRFTLYFPSIFSPHLWLIWQLFRMIDVSALCLVRVSNPLKFLVYTICWFLTFSTQFSPIISHNLIAIHLIGLFIFTRYQSLLFRDIY